MCSCVLSVTQSQLQVPVHTTPGQDAYQFPCSTVHQTVVEALKSHVLKLLAPVLLKAAVKVEQHTQHEVFDTSTRPNTPDEDHLADMGNTSSSSAGDGDTGPIETEQNGIGRMQAITGAKAVETRVKPRGPKADPADHGYIQVSRSAVACPGKHAYSAMLLCSFAYTL